MPREPFDVNFCIFAGCSQLVDRLCIRDECWINDTMVAWWRKHLYPNPLVTSNPPPGKKGLLNIYFDPNVGDTGEYVFEREE